MIFGMYHIHARIPKVFFRGGGGGPSLATFFNFVFSL